MAEAALDVRALLSAASGKSKARPSVHVDREDDLVYDLGHLCAYDPSPVDEEALSSEGTSEYLLRVNRDNAQLLTNQLYRLLESAPSKKTIPLPPPTTQLPREKPLPEERPTTRWEKFAQSKGIVKKKRSKMVWDESSQQWAPRYGYGRANNPKDDAANWVVEAKAGDDGTVDPFEARAEKKKMKLDKQKRQEDRNRLEAAHAASIGSGGGGGGGRVGSGGSALQGKADKKAYLKKAISAAQGSTASMGRFDKALPNEPSKSAGKRKKYETGVGAAEADADAKRAKSVVERLFPEAGRKHQVAVKRDVAAKKSKLEHEAKNRKAGAGAGKKPAAKGGKGGGKGGGKSKGKGGGKGKKK